MDQAEALWCAWAYAIAILGLSVLLLIANLTAIHDPPPRKDYAFDVSSGLLTGSLFAVVLLSLASILRRRGRKRWVPVLCAAGILMPPIAAGLLGGRTWIEPGMTTYQVGHLTLAIPWKYDPYPRRDPGYVRVRFCVPNHLLLLKDCAPKSRTELVLRPYVEMPDEHDIFEAAGLLVVVRRNPIDETLFPEKAVVESLIRSWAVPVPSD